LQEVRIQIVVEVVNALHNVEVGEGGRRVDGSVPEDGSTAGVWAKSESCRCRPCRRFSWLPRYHRTR
jgi:hypothetical protein